MNWYIILPNALSGQFETQKRRELYHDEQEFAVMDTIEGTLPRNGGTVRCLQWIRWVDHLRPIERDQQGSNSRSYYTVTGAIILFPVDEENHIYHRIGWLEVVDDHFFEEEFKSISLI